MANLDKQFLDDGSTEGSIFDFGSPVRQAARNNGKFNPVLDSLDFGRNVLDKFNSYVDNKVQGAQNTFSELAGQRVDTPWSAAKQEQFDILNNSLNPLSDSEQKMLSELTFERDRFNNSSPGINFETGLSGIGNLLQGAGGAYSAYTGKRQYDLASDAFDFEKENYENNKRNSIKDYNSKNRQEYLAAVSGTGTGGAYGYNSLADYQKDTNIL